MATLGALVMFFGFCFVLGSPLMALLAWNDGRERRRLERVPTRTCAELVGSQPARCALAGEVGAGPSGLQIAPLSGAAVAWHRTRVWRWYAVSGENYRELVWSHTSDGPFSVRDATGSVLVSPALFAADADSPSHSDHPLTERVLTEHESSDRRSGRHGGPALRQLIDRGLLPPGVVQRAVGRSTRAWEVDEVVLRAEQQVYVVATPSRHEGRVLLERPRRGFSLISSRTEQELREDLQEGARVGYQAARWFPVVGAVLLGLGALVVLVATPSAAG